MQVVQERVEGWQDRALYSMAKITLIKSVLSSLLIYMLSRVVISKSVILSIEQIIRAFLWGVDQGGRGVRPPIGMACDLSTYSSGGSRYSFFDNYTRCSISESCIQISTLF